MRKYTFLFSLLLLLLFLSVNFESIELSKLVYKSGIIKVSKAFQQSSIQIKERNPVVNEGNKITLSVIDSRGNSIRDGIAWVSGSPDIAQVNPANGEISGIKSGFATISAIRNGESFSVFLTVAKVRGTGGASVSGDTKSDVMGSVYISNPAQHVILKVEGGINAVAKPFAGRPRLAGRRDGMTKTALFAGPTAIGVDNRTQGGLYIADTLNHNIRKIGFDGQVQTILGKSSPGLSQFSSNGKIDLEKTLLSSPRGVVTDNGGNFYLSDTDNHAIYYVDINKRQVNILVGEPGQSGKADGIGRNARLKRPSALALSSDGRLLTVADEDNNRVRLIEISRSNSGELTGNVSTLGVATSSEGLRDITLNKESDEIAFNKPQSVSFDGLGNVYVVDSQSVKFITRTKGKMPEVFDLAQPNITFNKAVSITVKGTQAFVLDSSTRESEALKIVTVDSPTVANIEPKIITTNQAILLTITGKNFAPESQVVFGGSIVPTLSVKAEEIKVQIPPQNLPGRLTLSVLTRGGIAQQEVSAVSVASSSLATGELTTVAGGSIFLGNGGAATFANIRFPFKVLNDSAGNLFFADQGTKSVRRIDKQTGIITTIAGGGNSINDGVLATTFSFGTLSNIALDKNGDIFIVDNFRVIKKVNILTNIITTVAGKVDKTDSQGDGGLAINASFTGITDLTFDQKGNLLVLEFNRLRLIDTNTGTISTIAGSGKGGFNGDNGPAINAGIEASRIAIDKSGNIFIADGFINGRIRKIDTNRIITTIAGNGNPTNDINLNAADREGKRPTEVPLDRVRALAIDPQGNLFFSDNARSGNFNSSISKIDFAKQTIAIQKVNGVESDGGPVSPSTSGLAFDGLGNLFFTSLLGNIFQLDTKSGNAVRLAGRGQFNLVGDNDLAVKASLGDVVEAVSDPSGNLYIRNILSNNLRRVDARTGIISTIFEGMLFFPTSITISGNNLLVADLVRGVESGIIRQFDLTTGVGTIIAGNLNGNASNQDGKPALETKFTTLGSLTSDRLGNIYFIESDFVNPTRLRRIDAATRIVTTLVTFQNLDVVSDLAVDNQDSIYITIPIVDSNKAGKVFRFNIRTGILSLFAGGNDIIISTESSLATQANIGYPESVAVDASGNVFIASSGPMIENADIVRGIRVFRVDPRTNMLTTFARGKGGIYSGDGGAISRASLSDCSNIFITPNNELLMVNRDFLIQSIRLAKLPR